MKEKPILFSGPMEHPSQEDIRRIYQSSMWRDYAGAFLGRPTKTGVGKKWIEACLGVYSFKECIERAKKALKGDDLYGLILKSKGGK